MSKEKCRGYYKVPEFVISQIFKDMEQLGKMLKELINLHQEESRLKKHHKAYLHIREYTDVVCTEHEKKMEAIQDRWKEPAFACEDFGCGCDTQEEADEEEQLSLSASDFTESMVMMSGKNLGLMQDDLFLLAETIDVLILAMKALMSGRAVPDAKMAQMLAMMTAMTDMITSRWEDVEFRELS